MLNNVIYIVNMIRNGRLDIYIDLVYVYLSFRFLGLKG